jgi:transposase-like protein
MPVILLQIPKVNSEPDKRPQSCPYCQGNVLQRWGRVTKPIKSCGEVEAVIYRYRCSDCDKTFRHYPEGIDRAGHSRAIRRLAGLLSALGLTCRNIAEIFDGCGIDLSYSTIYRENQDFRNKLNNKHFVNYMHKFTIDKDYIHKVSSNFGVVMALDFGEEQYTILGALNEHNPTNVKSWLQTLLKDTGIKALQLGTDTLDVMYYHMQTA